MHHAAAEKYLFWSNALTVASLLMGLLGGCASLINTDTQSKWVTVGVGGLNLASAAVVTMKRNFQITELSTSHNMAARQYSAYFRQDPLNHQPLNASLFVCACEDACSPLAAQRSI